jgi:hypothetical protein
LSVVRIEQLEIVRLFRRLIVFREDRLDH